VTGEGKAGGPGGCNWGGEKKKDFGLPRKSGLNPRVKKKADKLRKGKGFEKAYMILTQKRGL